VYCPSSSSFILLCVRFFVQSWTGSSTPSTNLPEWETTPPSLSPLPWSGLIWSTTWSVVVPPHWHIQLKPRDKPAKGRQFIYLSPRDPVIYMRPACLPIYSTTLHRTCMPIYLTLLTSVLYTTVFVFERLAGSRQAGIVNPLPFVPRVFPTQFS
jgi:hypothetical protein